MNKTKYKQEVFSKLEVDGIHNWKNCLIDEVRFLRDNHRHIFHIKAYKLVTHSDRDVEFIQFKHILLDYLKEKYYSEEKRTHYFGSKSCEMIAIELIEKFDLTSCEVSEDGENGSLVKTI